MFEANPAFPMRQVHLDFHTAEQITQVGADFDPHRFAQRLAEAHVESINCFARGHHGYIYFDTQRFPERRHPHLTRNLLKEQIDACHAVGIKVPIYTTIQWDLFTARRHPEWLALDEDGRFQGPGPFEPGFRHFLLVNSPYFDFLKAHVAELFELLPVDGFWFDIVKPLNDCSELAREQMRARGLDPSDFQARQRFGLDVINTFKQEMTAFVRQYSADCTIFFNAGHISPAITPTLDCYTQSEIESIPSGEWGYTHFPITARYARTLDKPYLGMTGKFHTEWGDFHSLKNQEALEYECFQMLALGAGCSIGDQLHPNGALDEATYGLVGEVYAQVAAKEAWCRAVEPVVEIGVMLPAAFGNETTPPAEEPHLRIPRATAGAYQMLAADGFQFDFITPTSDFSEYAVIILPDDVRLESETAVRLADFIAQGGKLLASFEGGLPADGHTFPDYFGVDYIGPAPFNPDFVVPEGFLSPDLPPTEHVMYLRGAEVRARAGAQVIASTRRPYFNRTAEHFMSHQHAPSTGDVVYPAVIAYGNVVYFAHPIFSQYQHNGSRWVRTLLKNGLRHLLERPLVTHNAPSTLQVTINRQLDSDQTPAPWIIHLLHYIPIRRSDTIDVIEDVIPLVDLDLRLRVPQAVRQIRLVPEERPIAFEYLAGSVQLSIPRLEGHQMVELQFETA